MRENTIVAVIEQDTIVEILTHAPLYINRTGDFRGWLQDRGADLQRSYMRSILRHLGLPLLDVVAAVKYVHAASVTDSFWIRPSGSGLTYEDVKFSRFSYFKAALAGDTNLFSFPREHTPEITNIGSFNKGWKMVDGEWYLYKAGTRLEHFSELFTGLLAARLGLDAVEYWMDGDYIVCKNFVKHGSCFEPAKSLIGENIEYTANCHEMEKLGLLQPYLDILFMDAIVRNPDRHEFNYGFVTDCTGGIVIAPNFDNNVSLFSRGIPQNIERDDVLVNDFVDVLRELRAAGYVYEIPQLTEDIISDVYEQIGFDEIPLRTLAEFCMNAYRRITVSSLRA
jgi:hypothetical protein